MDADLLRRKSVRGRVEIRKITQGDGDLWTERYRCFGGAAYAEQYAATGDKSLAYALLDFHSLVVRDGVDPLTAHQAFLAIDEYRNALAEDCPK
jgi:hypothetical protein